MVEEVTLEPEVIQIFECIDQGKNFLLSGGAGSGKTYSLVQVIREAIHRNPVAHVACMTYTNAAVKEIEDRVNHQNLTVTTIHDFLWDQIKSFQKEIKGAMIALINDPTVTLISSDEAPVSTDYFDQHKKGIQYKEWLSLKDGFISHDELIVLAGHMFSRYTKLSDILKDKFKFVFIDEYQDTHKIVVDIFLLHLRKSARKNIIGFFGDAMQAIYEDGIGDLDAYRSGTDELVIEVKKEQNRRNPSLVIELANRLRTDGLTQEPSTDPEAPNMVDGSVKFGSIKFLYSYSRDLTFTKTTEFFAGWDFKDAKRTKELNLTHNLIAPKAGFKDLIEIYDKDPILKFCKELKNHIKENGLVIPENLTFHEVAIQIDLRVRKDSKLDLIISDPAKKFLYDQLKDVPFTIVRKMYQSKDALIDDKKQDEEDENKKGSKRDALVKHLFKIQFLIHLYLNKDYNEFIKRTEFKVTSIQDKIDIKNVILELDSMSTCSIDEVIRFADEKGICHIDDRLTRFVEEKKYLYDRVKQIPFSQFQKLFYYLEGYTPYSTQHKIKGAEFDNVLVNLDNGKWNEYNFKTLFIGGGSDRVLAQTQKIFYVCCTRAKENLIVYFNSPEHGVVAKAKAWFGEGHVHEIV